MIRTEVQTVYFPGSINKVWSAITSKADDSPEFKSMTPEEYSKMEPGSGYLLTEITEMKPLTRCAFRMRAPKFTTDWSADLEAASSSSVKVTITETIDYKSLYLWLISLIFVSQKKGMKTYVKTINEKLKK